MGRRVRVVLTRELGHNEGLRSRLPSGIDVTEVPLTRTLGRDHAEVAIQVRSCAEAPFASLVVTSARAADYVADVVEVLDATSRTYAVGPVTARALEDRGWPVARVGREGAAALARAIARGPVLVLAAERTRPELAAELAARNLIPVTIGCYATEPVEPDAAGRAALARADVVFVGAPSTWEVARRHVVPDAWVVVPGATTAAEVRRSHERVLEGWDGDLAARLSVLGGGRSAKAP